MKRTLFFLLFSISTQALNLIVKNVADEELNLTNKKLIMHQRIFDCEIVVARKYGPAPKPVPANDQPSLAKEMPIYKDISENTEVNPRIKKLVFVEFSSMLEMILACILLIALCSSWFWRIGILLVILRICGVI
jgi:hypothetical protein